MSLSSLSDDVADVQLRLEALLRSVTRLEQRVGAGGLEMRRVRTDADHLRESLALLRETTAVEPPHVHAAEPPRMEPPIATVHIPDTPYDSSLWADCDDEGVGARDRRAP